MNRNHLLELKSNIISLKFLFHFLIYSQSIMDFFEMKSVLGIQHKPHQRNWKRYKTEVQYNLCVAKKGYELAF